MIYTSSANAPIAERVAYPKSTDSSCCIGRHRELRHEIKEPLRLADEQPHVGQEFQCRHSNAGRFGRSNDRTMRQVAAEEWARLRHDEFRLKQVPAERRWIEIRECQSVCWIG